MQSRFSKYLRISKDLSQLSLLMFLLILQAFSPVHSDGTGPIAKDKPLTKKELSKIPKVIQIEKSGDLLPWRTYQLDETIPRPKYWNGYGVDPQGPNYYYYFDQYPCRYEFMNTEELCKVEPKEPQKPVNVPEPRGLLAITLITSMILMVLKRRRQWAK